MFVRGFAVGVLIGVAILTLMAMGSDSSAMKQCQQTHSYDTCFQLLNR
jgi:hypothetical protein